MKLKREKTRLKKIKDRNNVKLWWMDILGKRGWEPLRILMFLEERGLL